MLRMAIADQTATLDDVRRWAATGIDFVQLRAKSLQAGTLLRLAEDWLRMLDGSKTRLLINSRVDVAIAAGAAGIHLTSRSGALFPAQVRKLMPAAFVSVSTHSLAEVTKAKENGADLILFGPVFEKRIAGNFIAPGTGLPLLNEACRLAGVMSVLALGGVTHENSNACLDAGAAGIAGIRLFS